MIYSVVLVFGIQQNDSHIYVCVCMKEINPLPVTSFANIFSSSVDCLLIMFMSFHFVFAVQKLFSLIRSHLFIFSFSPINVGDRAKKQKKKTKTKTKKNCCD